jgi:hypothetical protein
MTAKLDAAGRVAARQPQCEADLSLPCRCVAVFAAHDERIKHIEAVEAHQGVMKRDERRSLMQDVIRDLTNHKLGRCYV